MIVEWLASTAKKFKKEDPKTKQMREGAMIIHTCFRPSGAIEVMQFIDKEAVAAFDPVKYNATERPFKKLQKIVTLGGNFGEKDFKPFCFADRVEPFTP